jgi:anti-sigma B factor antagonist
MKELEFEVESERVSEDAWIVSVAGEVDLYTAPQLEEQLAAVINEGPRRVVVDLTEATFVDSTTLGVLLEALRRLGAAGGQLAVVAAHPNVTKVFEITGLDRVFALYSTNGRGPAPSADR